MGYSPLVDYVKISPNRNSPRNSTVKKITIHHMAGILTVEQCGEVFAPASREASSNYAIDNNLRVGCYVDEKDRSWASSSPINDHQAITIELANDKIGGNWHVADAVIEKCIDLCTDICLRNDIKSLNFTGDTSGNLTMHKWFTSTTCPGPYLESKFPYIAKQVNNKLKEARGELTMDQYKELTNEIKQLRNQVDDMNIRLSIIDAIQLQVDNIDNFSGLKYNYVDSNLPIEAQAICQKLLGSGVIKQGDVRLSDSTAHVLAMLDALKIMESVSEYETLDDVPEWGRPVIERLLKAGIIKGTGTRLGITEQTVKILVYLDRAKVLNI